MSISAMLVTKSVMVSSCWAIFVQNVITWVMSQEEIGWPSMTKSPVVRGATTGHEKGVYSKHRLEDFSGGGEASKPGEGRLEFRRKHIKELPTLVGGSGGAVGGGDVKEASELAAVASVAVVHEEVGKGKQVHAFYLLVGRNVGNQPGQQQQ